MQILQSLEPLRGSDIIDRIMVFISALGNSGVIFIFFAVLMLCFRQSRKAGLLCGTSLIFDFVLVNLILKPLIARPRPFDIGVLDVIIPMPHDFSFPSGHTAAAFAFAAALIPMGKKKYIPAMLFAAVIGASRLYLGVHYPSDVAAGAVIGFICGKAAYFVWKRSGKYDIM